MTAAIGALKGPLHGGANKAVMLERKSIHPNLDYPTGLVYDIAGFDIDVFTPLFVMSRITGWTAHIMEQAAANSLIRPLSSYVGQARREVPDATPER